MNKNSKSESIPGKQTVSFQCADAIEISLFIEKEGLIFYEKATKNVSDPRVKDMFTRLAEEETEHIQSVEKRKETGCESYFFAFDG
jgi:rubrerythrin